MARVASPPCASRIPNSLHDRDAVWPGGVRAVIAEHLLLKQQLLILHRLRQRAPHLTASDRRLFGFWSLFLSPGRIRKIAI